MARKKKSEFDKLLNKFVSECYHTDFKMMGTYTSECDDAQGFISVTCACDGDMHLHLTPHDRMDYNPVFRARTFFGGGRKERTRLALAFLACAIKADAESEYEY